MFIGGVGFLGQTRHDAVIVVVWMCGGGVVVGLMENLLIIVFGGCFCDIIECMYGKWL